MGILLEVLLYPLFFFEFCADRVGSSLKKTTSFKATLSSGKASLNWTPFFTMVSIEKKTTIHFGSAGFKIRELRY